MIKIKEDEVGRTCSTRCGGEKYIEEFCEKGKEGDH
jgi:hypothetical protein